MKILVIEDERNVAAMIQSLMVAEGYECLTAFDGLQGLKQFEVQQPNLVILDWNLPGVNGIDLCTRIRQSRLVDPYILMLTARQSEDDRLDGFSSGVDDYMSKPFRPKELTVRVRSLLRRELRHPAEAEVIIQTSFLRIDPESLTVDVRGVESEPFRPLKVKLSSREFNLLATLARRPGRIWTRDDLLSTVWDSDFLGSDRVVDAFVKQLRSKVRIPDPNRSEHFIKTQIGVGYFFEES